MRPIALILNEKSEGGGLFRDELRRARIPSIEIDARRQPLPAIEDVSAFVVLGGDQHVYQISEHPYLARELKMMAAAVESGKPLMGICLGAQLLAAALGASVRPAPVRQCRFAPYLPTTGLTDPLFSSFLPGDRLLHWHEDTFDVPNGGTLLSGSDQVANQSFRVGSRAWGSQFHLEVDHSMVKRWVDAEEEFPLKWGRSQSEFLEEAHRHLPRQVAHSRTLIRQFVKIVNDSEHATDVEPRPLRPAH